MSASGNEYLRWRQPLRETLRTPVEAVDHDISWSLCFSDPDRNPFEITSYYYEQIAAELRETNQTRACRQAVLPGTHRDPNSSLPKRVLLKFYMLDDKRLVIHDAIEDSFELHPARSFTGRQVVANSSNPKRPQDAIPT